MIAVIANYELDPVFDAELSFVGFALGDCIVKLVPRLAKYLRAVHRTALELAVHNYFGVQVGGFWLMSEQIEQLLKLPEYYPPNEAPAVAQTVEAYLKTQLRDLDPVVNNIGHALPTPGSRRRLSTDSTSS